MRKNELTNDRINFLGKIFESFLSEPGDEVSARVTKSKRKVIKAQKDGGKNKISQTVYSNGTRVTTITQKPQ